MPHSHQGLRFLGIILILIGLVIGIVIVSRLWSPSQGPLSFSKTSQVYDGLGMTSSSPWSETTYMNTQGRTPEYIFFTFILFGVAITIFRVGVTLVKGSRIFDHHLDIFEEAHHQIRQQQAMAAESPKSDAPQSPANSVNYTCQNCSATLGKNADVSPLGDVKCVQCGRWFNIFGRKTS